AGTGLLAKPSPADAWGYVAATESGQYPFAACRSVGHCRKLSEKTRKQMTGRTGVFIISSCSFRIVSEMQRMRQAFFRTIRYGCPCERISFFECGSREKPERHQNCLRSSRNER